MYQGGCLCGAIRFEISSNIDDIVYCHCSQCRKAQGSAFAANGNIKATDFRFVSGEDKLTAYAAGATLTKYFCRICGSPLISKNSTKPALVRVRIGTIESDITERPGAHVFVGSKAKWDIICDDLPQYQEFPPSR